MFWSGNYIVVRELKCLLKEENVTLTQVLEADDILQECKADNKALIQFLTRPDILAELITLIIEEPPKNVELSSQYRHANIASEVLTSNLSMLRDRLSMEATQMNRLCDFVNRDPPLNPLLASYFSKTVEMLLERSPKQDWYLHNIVCLHVLDTFKARRDFLPNLLRHMATSAVCDTFTCFLQLAAPFDNIILEWLDKHQFLESLIQIICGTFDPEEALAAALASAAPPPDEQAGDTPHNQHSERLDANHNAEGDDSAPTDAEVNNSASAATNGETADDAALRSERARAVAAANAAALLCDIATVADPYKSGWNAGRALAKRLRGEDAVRRLLQAVFTSPARARRAALVHACRLLLALLADGEDAGGVERALAPHLPLLHHALLQGEARVGAARLAVAALLARLALSEAEDVPTALISLGSAAVLLELLFRFPHNNFLHAQVCALVLNARANRLFSHRYTAHLIEECDLLTRFMDAFEQNEEAAGRRGVRAGYMGHVLGVLRSLDAAPPALPSALQQRWDAFREDKLRPLLQRHDTPLGGIYPWENNMYEFNETAASYEEGAEVWEPLAEPLAEPLSEPLAEPLDGPREDPMSALDESKRTYFLELLKSRHSLFDDDQWDDAEPAPSALQHDSPWEGSGGGGAGGEEGWAQFEPDAAPPADPFACAERALPADAFWSPEAREQPEAAGGAPAAGAYEDTLTVLLARKMLTAFRHMPPDEAPAAFPLADPATEDAPPSSRESPPPDAESPPPDVEIALSNDEIAPSNDEIALSDVEITSSNVEIAPSNVEIAPSNDEIVLSNDAIVLSNDKIVPSNVEIAPSHIEIAPSKVEIAENDSVQNLPTSTPKQIVEETSPAKSDATETRPPEAGPDSPPAAGLPRPAELESRAPPADR
ncbi:serine/threonine-protein phosphatase 6 regulatory subunit 3 isoform X2 [Bicyclus anynana]|uniref:Serine/threonine-protein phosphatase 6 regulatory subunit 3 isoform X2 n=1 Tax=Bicyclus anynana TaxID=110368 RepID=A0ABM3LQ01_BICAN|nr:serine/threonine-protein phosphatase 6 regulatory subunit 3 isoform X2 [Bicyclus anynana]